MANDIYTFYPHFSEFLPVYRGVSRVWIGDGVNTGTTGMLYAEFETGEITELGSVTSYAIAVANGYTGTANEWAEALMSLAVMSKAATVSVKYLASNSGTSHPAADAEWGNSPSADPGEYLWTKITLQWMDSTTSDVYTVSYQGQDGGVVSVNGQTGVISLNGANIPIAANNNQTIKSYIDTLTFDPEIATNAEIDQMFGIEPVEPEPEEP